VYNTPHYGLIVARCPSLKQNLYWNEITTENKAVYEEARKYLEQAGFDIKAVVIDAKKTKSIIAIKPKPPFIPIFQVAVTKGGSDIRIINEPLRSQSGSPVVFLVETGEGRTPRPEEATRNMLQA
jgi:site-specific DNA recombinase